MTAGTLRTEIVRDEERFAALSEAWDALAEHAGTPLARHAWYCVALSALQRHLFELSVVLVWDGTLLVAAAPLILDKSLSPSRLSPIDGFIGEPFRLLYRDPEALQMLGKACAALRRPILFRRLESSEADLALLLSALRSNSALYCKPRHASATIRLPDSFEAFEAAMSTSRRSTLRRKWRAALRAHGDIVAEFVTPEPANVPAQLARIEAIEGSGWKQRSGTALSNDRRMGRFVAQLADSFAQDRKLVLAYLKIGGRDAACRLILRQQSGWFEIKIGFDEEFARLSPGVLLMHETLREACRMGIDSYAFLGLHEGWQDHWPHEVSEDYRLATYPARPSGVIALVTDGWQAASSFVRRF